jgi:hypothetical protein
MMVIKDFVTQDVTLTLLNTFCAHSHQSTNLELAWGGGGYVDANLHIVIPSTRPLSCRNIRAASD